MLDGMPYCLDDFQNDTLSHGEFCRHLSMDRGISRGMPRDEDLGSYAQAMKILLIDGSIDPTNQRIPQTIHEIVAEAYRRGFVNRNMAGLYTLPSPLHQYLWSWRLEPQANYQLPFQDLYSFVKSTVSHFRPTQLDTSDRRVGSASHRPPEAQYQEEYYHCVYNPNPL